MKLSKEMKKCLASLAQYGWATPHNTGCGTSTFNALVKRGLAVRNSAPGYRLGARFDVTEEGRNVMESILCNEK